VVNDNVEAEAGARAACFASDLEAAKKSPPGTGLLVDAGPDSQARLPWCARPRVALCAGSVRRAHADTGRAGAGVAGSTLERAPAPVQAGWIILQSITWAYGPDSWRRFFPVQ
jgi:hypothetical protein